MFKIQKYRVLPYLPENLRPLMNIASNFWWVWNYDAIDLFRRLDVDLWRTVQHNPIKLLGSISQKLIDEAAESESFIAHMERVEEELELHLTRKTWFDEFNIKKRDVEIAYFSAEFGIHESLPIYSGGLGILAGDHLKSSSELGIPLSGVGLLYRLGYFHQYLNIDGWQQEIYPETDFYNIAVSLVMNDEDQPLLIGVEFPERIVYAQIWKALIGRTELYLLDTNIDKNCDEDKSITDGLYAGDIEMRIKQEMMLGIGGTRALKAIGKEITVYHMNEGHSAFMGIERIRTAMKDYNLSYAEALEFVRSSNIFTTHTPVPAGNDRFSPDLLEEYMFHHYNEMGMTVKDFLALGRENPDDDMETFCMTVLAIKTSSYYNGVSLLHGDVSRKMWKGLWPTLPIHEVPIRYITNGTQMLSWASDEIMRLLNRYLGPRWIDNPVDKDIWQNIDSIPNTELWRCRERMREILVGFARRTLMDQLIKRETSKNDVEIADTILDPEALTIGFARRFATYKRATLIFRNMDRLEKLLLNRDRPIQFIFAGKAHPRDHAGKELIRHIIHLARDPRFRNKIVFIEDYDINIARYLVQGVDVWLNTPIRPMEASGTSGMKVVPNGGLNISILDGWWLEAYNGNNGWAIGSGEDYDDHDYQDEVESEFLYNILEEDVIPMFYNRGTDGLPRAWIARIKESMKSICPTYNTNRMVREYIENFYINAHNNFKLLSDNDFNETKKYSLWKDKINKVWKNIKIKDLNIKEAKSIIVGSEMKIEAIIDISVLETKDVIVELYNGSLNSKGDIEEGSALSMTLVKHLDKSTYLYEGSIPCQKTGQFGFTVRVVPNHQRMIGIYEPGLITWASVT
ncbi:MAG: alpha-glucan family phosphorylase [Spirochaetota bacterium]|nr:alpha-glucan family phosphorylase [Spirochaetota bacterium]